MAVGEILCGLQLDITQTPSVAILNNRMQRINKDNDYDQAWDIRYYWQSQVFSWANPSDERFSIIVLRCLYKR